MLRLKVIVLFSLATLSTCLFYTNMVLDVSPNLQPALAMERRTASTLSDIRLSILPASAGRSTYGTLEILNSSDVLGFNLLVHHNDNNLLSIGSDLQINSVYLPNIEIGNHKLNSIRQVNNGSIRIVALEPEPSDRTVEIARIRYQIASDALIGATQQITVTGEINYADRGVIIIEPVVATFYVTAPDTGSSNHQYLPLIQN